MSDHNNIYNIMGKLNALTPSSEPVTQSTQRVYESVDAQGSILEGVKKVEANLNEKYMGFKAVEKSAKASGAKDPAAVAAAAGRKKYGKKAFQKAAASGKKMGESQDVAEERETLATKTGTIYKGGNYGTEFDVGDDGEKKPKAKVPGQGRGRPKKEAPPTFTKTHDLFGRVKDVAHKGKKGTKVKGQGTLDTVDESAPKGWEGTVKKMKKNKDIDNPWALANYMKNKGYKSHVKESKIRTTKALLESVNFKKMMDEANMTVDEMLECINQDIQVYKATGDMSNRLRDFMHLHRHMKTVDEAADRPDYELPAVQRKAKGDTPLTLPAVRAQDAERSMHPGMTKLDAPKPAEVSIDEELDELAKLAGITDEGNAFSGALAKARASGKNSFEVDGEEYPVDEDDMGPVQLESKTSLEDIARLSGIFQEGKDYGDTSFNEPPEYDNSPDECVQGEEVMLHGGDGEVAGQEKKMAKMGSARFSDNPMATESKSLIKPAAEFNFVKEMGRDLMKAYQDIKTK